MPPKAPESKAAKAAKAMAGGKKKSKVRDDGRWMTARGRRRASTKSQGVDDVEAEDGEDGGLETQKDAVTEGTMPEDAPNGAK